MAEAKQNQKNLRKQQQEDQLRAHNEALEQRRREKGQAFDDKLNRVQSMKDSDAAAIREIARMKHENTIAKE